MSLNHKILSISVLLALAGTASAKEQPAIARAMGLLQSHGSEIRASASDRFRSRDVIVDADGSEHVRFERSYAGLPVIGGDFVVHSRNGVLRSTSLSQRAPLQLSPLPRIT